MSLTSVLTLTGLSWWCFFHLFTPRNMRSDSWLHVKPSSLNQALTSLQFSDQMTESNWAVLHFRWQTNRVSLTSEMTRGRQPAVTAEEETLLSEHPVLFFLLIYLTANLLRRSVPVWPFLTQALLLWWMLSRSFLNTKDEAGRLVSASHAGGTTQTSSDVRRAERSHNVLLPPPLSPLTSSPPPLLPCYCLPLKVFTSLTWTQLFLLLFPPFLSASGRYVGPVLTLESVLT